MLVAYQRPGVYYERVDAQAPAISPLRTDIAGFVGLARTRSGRRARRLSKATASLRRTSADSPESAISPMPCAASSRTADAALDRSRRIEGPARRLRRQPP